jgi:hypothetical protein
MADVERAVGEKKLSSYTTVRAPGPPVVQRLSPDGGPDAILCPEKYLRGCRGAEELDKGSRTLPLQFPTRLAGQRKYDYREAARRL